MKIIGAAGLAGLWACKLFLCQSIGIDETNTGTFQLKDFSNTKIVGATGLGGLLALVWVWHTFFWINL